MGPDWVLNGTGTRLSLKWVLNGLWLGPASDSDLKVGSKRVLNGSWMKLVPDLVSNGSYLGPAPDSVLKVSQTGPKRVLNGSWMELVPELALNGSLNGSELGPNWDLHQIQSFKCLKRVLNVSWMGLEWKWYQNWVLKWVQNGTGTNLRRFWIKMKPISVYNKSKMCHKRVLNGSWMGPLWNWYQI